MRGQQEAGRSQSQLWPGASCLWRGMSLQQVPTGWAEQALNAPLFPGAHGAQADTGLWCCMEAGFS